MYFFESEERRAELKKELDRWMGTPFKHHCGVRGRGADCLHMGIRVFENMGLGPFRVPEYPPDWHKHKPSEQLIEGIMGQLNADRFDKPVPAPMDGDVVLFRFKRTVCHTGIYSGEYIYTAIERLGVKRFRVTSGDIARRADCIFRVRA